MTWRTDKPPSVCPKDRQRWPFGSAGRVGAATPAAEGVHHRSRRAGPVAARPTARHLICVVGGEGAAAVPPASELADASAGPFSPRQPPAGEGYAVPQDTRADGPAYPPWPADRSDATSPPSPPPDGGKPHAADRCSPRLSSFQQILTRHHPDEYLWLRLPTGVPEERCSKIRRSSLHLVALTMMDLAMCHIC